MSLTLELQPEIERNLLAQAHARGISLSDFARELLTQAASPTQPTNQMASERQAGNLYELFAPVRGLLTDEEIDQFFARTASPSRIVDFE